MAVEDHDVSPDAWDSLPAKVNVTRSKADDNSAAAGMDSMNFAPEKTISMSARYRTFRACVSLKIAGWVCVTLKGLYICWLNRTPKPVMLHYETIPVTPFQQNCSIVWCDETMQAAIIDPGGDLDVLLAAVKHLGLKLEQIWITHAHIDHAGGTAELAEHLGLPIIGPQEDDQFWIDGLAQAAASYGFPPSRAFTPTRWLHDGDTVTLGAHTLNVRHCPGHTPGHVVFYSPEIKRAFVGDVLFAGSIGRTDFPRGNHQDLIDSITQRLWPMGDDTVFIPGHGPESTFGRERVSNPYVGGT